MTASYTVRPGVEFVKTINEGKRDEEVVRLEGTESVRS